MGASTTGANAVRAVCGDMIRPPDRKEFRANGKHLILVAQLRREDLIFLLSLRYASVDFKDSDCVLDV